MNGGKLEDIITIYFSHVNKLHTYISLIFIYAPSVFFKKKGFMQRFLWVMFSPKSYSPQILLSQAADSEKESYRADQAMYW